MSRRLYPHNRVSYCFAYEIDEICKLYADFNLHPQTVRKWVRNGLKTIDNGKPILIFGKHLIDFLRSNNQSNKHKTEPDQMFCMFCQDARYIFQKKIHIEQKYKVLIVQGACRACKTKMFKNYKMEALATLKKEFKLCGLSELYDCSVSSDKTHLQDNADVHQSESDQLDLF
jgi:hypothetical protein